MYIYIYTGFRLWIATPFFFVSLEIKIELEAGVAMNVLRLFAHVDRIENEYGWKKFW